MRKRFYPYPFQSTERDTTHEPTQLKNRNTHTHNLSHVANRKNRRPHRTQRRRLTPQNSQPSRLPSIRLHAGFLRRPALRTSRGRRSLRAGSSGDGGCQRIPAWRAPRSNRVRDGAGRSSHRLTQQAQQTMGFLPSTRYWRNSKHSFGFSASALPR